MAHNALKIPKRQKQVTLWIHPEGRVIGALFLRPQSINAAGEEEPVEALNQPDPFLVLRRENPEELRFYNKASVVRVEYTEENPLRRPEIEPLHCTLHLMDGSVVVGNVWKALPPDRARLFDYLNLAHERFVKLYCEDGGVCVVNKSYITCVTP